MNDTLHRMLRKKQRLYNKAKKSGSWSRYKEVKKKCQQMARQAEYTYIQDKINEALLVNDTKPFWKYIKSKRNDNNNIAPLLKNGQLVSEDAEKANILLEQFTNVFSPLVPTVFEKPDKLHHIDMPDIEITTEGVEKLLSQINPAKSPGPDQIPNVFLKTMCKEIAPIITHLFQRSLTTSQLPADWLRGNISCIYKKGDRHKAENYRPVTLTSVICKLLEHIICRNIIAHYEANKILTSLNHGFRSGYSCETQLLTVIDDFTSSYESNTQTDIGVLDFSKAFDKVSHNKLILKLEQYGVRDNIVCWLQNFLMTRSMQVVVNNRSSKSAHVQSGVPQGTVLGPLLFLTYINDLPSQVSSTVRLFADDCLIYRTIKSTQDRDALQADLDSLSIWAEKWDMDFNAKKCNVMSIRCKKSHSYTINNETLETVNDISYLGLTICNSLSWSKHIAKITSKASSMLGFLSRNLRVAPQSCKQNAYSALVRSRLEYSSTVWKPTTVKDTKMLEKVQNRAARFIMHDYKSREKGSVTKMKETLNLEQLEQRRNKKRLQMLAKIVADRVPPLPSEKYIKFRPKQKRKIKARHFENQETINLVTRYQTKNENCMVVQHATTIPRKTSFFLETPILWNDLENDEILKMMESMTPTPDSPSESGRDM